MADIGVGLREGVIEVMKKWNAEKLQDTTSKPPLLSDNKGGAPPPFLLPLVVPLPTTAASDALIDWPGRSEIKSAAGAPGSYQSGKNNNKIRN